MVRTLLAVVLWLCFMLGGYVAYTALHLPNVRTALQQGVEPAQTTQILASDHSVIMSYGKFRHKPLPLKKISPTLIDALLATEDRRFRNHAGIDLIGIGRDDS